VEVATLQPCADFDGPPNEHSRRYRKPRRFAPLPSRRQAMDRLIKRWQELRRINPA